MIREPSRRFTRFVEAARGATWRLPDDVKALAWQKLRAARWTASQASPSLSARPAARRRPMLRLAAACAVVGALVGVAWVVSDHERSRPWAYAVELGAPDGNERALASTTGPGDLTFSDGTRVQISSTAKISVDTIHARGADMRLIDGAIDVHVRPLPNAHWTFSAGPFKVLVKGTAFRMEWLPGRARLSVKMWSGAVVVEGRRGRALLSLRAGESAVLSGTGEPEPTPGAEPAPALGPTPGSEGAAAAAPSPSTSLSPSLAPSPSALAAAPPAPDPAASAREAPLPSLSPDRHHPRPGRRRHAFSLDRRGTRASARSGASATWSVLLARGAFFEIVEEARRRGVDATLAQGSEVDIAALADAARYTREGLLAQKALLALRERFPDGERARNGAFFLGRLGESGGAGPEAALFWYDRYLRESPRGPYVEGALAREMVLLGQQKSQAASARARALAQRYLDEYGHGAYRALALGLLQGREVR